MRRHRRLIDRSGLPLRRLTRENGAAAATGGSIFAISTDLAEASGRISPTRAPRTTPRRPDADPSAPAPVMLVVFPFHSPSVTGNFGGIANQTLVGNGQLGLDISTGVMEIATQPNPLSGQPFDLSDAELCLVVAEEVLRTLPEMADYVCDPLATEQVRSHLRKLRRPSLGTARAICERAVLLARRIGFPTHVTEAAPCCGFARRNTESPRHPHGQGLPASPDRAA